jgi:hypothetical protein
VPRVLSFKSGDISRTIPSFSHPLNLFLNKNVIVSVEKLAVAGKLVSYQDSERM